MDWSSFILLHAEDAGNALLVRTAKFDSWKNESMALEIAEMGPDSSNLDLLMR